MVSITIAPRPTRHHLGVSPPRRRPSALSIGRNTKNGASVLAGGSPGRVFRQTCSSVTTPSTATAHNVYIGENFSVRLLEYFKFCKVVCDKNKSGIIHTDFDSFRKMNRMSLSDAANKMKDTPNAGGSSVISEVLSFELMRRCFGAQLLKTEMEVEYFPEGGSITDFTCRMFDIDLGVSVTRAMKFKGDYTQDDALKLLNKKLNGVLQSSRNALDKWSKQVLHVWATSRDVANILTQTYDQLVSAETKENTVVLVTIATNAPEIFVNH